MIYENIYFRREFTDNNGRESINPFDMTKG